MSDSFGRLALGLVGAAILAPFGMAALGFSIGSAIGGFLFAPEGPSVEGPRLGDMDVTASTLGKIIPEHYGTTRSAGNVFWSAGLKEVKTEEEQEGGKGPSGGGGTVTTYEYFASFAMAFGKGPAQELRRMWADGKLIYDATGSGDVKTGDFNFRFRKGVSNPDNTSGTIDPLIEESINRRLAGIPDVNQGNQEQLTYTTFNDIIADLQTQTDPRSAIYLAALEAKRELSEGILTSVTGGLVVGKQYSIYSFGTTTEAVWNQMGAGYTTSYQTSREGDTFEIIIGVEEGASFVYNGYPPSGSGVVRDLTAAFPPSYGFTPSYKEMCYIVFDDVPLADFGNRIPNITAEIVWQSDAVVDPADTIGEIQVSEISAELGAPAYSMAVDYYSRSLATITGSTMRRFSQANASETTTAPRTSGTTTVNRILFANASGDFIAQADLNGTSGLVKLPNSSITIPTSPVVPATLVGNATFGSTLGISGSRALGAICDVSGNFAIIDTGATEIYPAFEEAALGIGDGPMVYGGGTPGDTCVYWASTDGTNVQLWKIGVVFGNTPATSYSPNTSDPSYPTVTYTLLDTVGVAGGAMSTLIYDRNTESVYIIMQRNGGGGVVYRYDPNAEGTSGDEYLQDSFETTVTPPNMGSGLSRSALNGGTMAWASDDNINVVNLFGGEEQVFLEAASGVVSPNTQVYDPNNGRLFTFVGDVPTNFEFNRLLEGQLTTDLSSVVASICDRVGMEPDEYDVTAIAGVDSVRGYTIGRASTGRKVLENLFRAYFIEGIESDWQIKFQERQTTAIRAIFENELGKVEGPTGMVPYGESRSPEYDLPAEIAVIFSDKNRDYQQGSAHYKRVSQPVPVMYSKKIENIELPLVFNEIEARGIAERILFFSWLSRDQGKTKLSWEHIDLDPGDVVEFRFNNGLTLTERLERLDIGANFEIETSTSRSGDPVFTKTISSGINTSSIPTNSIRTPAYAKLFVMDIPLLYDFHDLGRIASRFYVAVGSDTTTFSSADIYGSNDGLGFSSFDTANVDVTWGTVTSGALPPPRALHSTDDVNEFTVQMSVDNGDISSTTLDDLVVNERNRCLLYNPGTNTGEILQFKNVISNGGGSYTFYNLIRGRRGTDQEVFNHTEGEVFILISDNAVLPEVNALSAVGLTRYFKAASRGSVIAAAPVVGEEFDGNDLKPYAPSYVRRTDDGTDLTVLWNRRTRINGAWNMAGTGIENVPLNEDFEQYEIFLLPNVAGALDDFNPIDVGTYTLLKQTNITSQTFTALELTAAGYTVDDSVNVAVFQLSAQVGRGFGRVVSLAP